MIRRDPPSGSLSDPGRATACNSCATACMFRRTSGLQSDSQCVETLWYGGNNGADVMRKATDLGQHWGVNIRELRRSSYLRDLYELGVLGPGREIEESALPWSDYGSLAWAEAFVRQVALRTTPFGDDLAEGIARATTKWGRYTMDTDTRLLALPNWGDEEHYDPRVEVDWSYASILGDRDMNEHGFNYMVYWQALDFQRGNFGPGNEQPALSAEEMVNIISEKTLPYTGDPLMWDYSEGPTGIYSAHRAKTIAWNRHYSRFWQQGAIFCCWAWPDFVNGNVANWKGATPEGEPMFWNAITGQNLTFLDGMEIGRRVLNLDRSVWHLQGRHRDMEYHTGYVYNVPTLVDWPGPAIVNGQWQYGAGVGRVLDRTRFDEWKTLYFDLEGWDNTSGWPSRSTLEELDLGFVADKLAAENKLGATGTYVAP